jgi:hypothetical protein
MLYPLSYRGGAGAKGGRKISCIRGCRQRGPIVEAPLTIRVCFPQADSDAAATISVMRARPSGSCRAAGPQAAAWVVGGSLLRPR